MLVDGDAFVLVEIRFSERFGVSLASEVIVLEGVGDRDFPFLVIGPIVLKVLLFELMPFHKF
jgi:hypothetical protein